MSDTSPDSRSVADAARLRNLDELVEEVGLAGGLVDESHRELVDRTLAEEKLQRAHSTSLLALDGIRSELLTNGRLARVHGFDSTPWHRERHLLRERRLASAEIAATEVADSLRRAGTARVAAELEMAAALAEFKRAIANLKNAGGRVPSHMLAAWRSAARTRVTRPAALQEEKGKQELVDGEELRGPDDYRDRVSPVEYEWIDSHDWRSAE